MPSRCLKMLNYWNSQTTIITDIQMIRSVTWVTTLRSMHQYRARAHLKELKSSISMLSLMESILIAQCLFHLQIQRQLFWRLSR